MSSQGSSACMDSLKPDEENPSYTHMPITQLQFTIINVCHMSPRLTRHIQLVTI